MLVDRMSTRELLRWLGSFGESVEDEPDGLLETEEISIFAGNMRTTSVDSKRPVYYLFCDWSCGRGP